MLRAVTLRRSALALALVQLLACGEPDPGPPPAEAAGDTAPAEAVPALLDLLEHKVEQIRLAAASQLLRRNPAGASARFHEATGASERARAAAEWRRIWRQDPKRFR